MSEDDLMMTSRIEFTSRIEHLTDLLLEKEKEILSLGDRLAVAERDSEVAFAFAALAATKLHLE